MFVPTSTKLTLAAGVAQVLTNKTYPLTVQIPTGTTALVETTCSTLDEVDANTADWVAWPSGAKAGPYADVLEFRVVAVRVTSAAGGVVYLLGE